MLVMADTEHIEPKERHSEQAKNAIARIRKNSIQKWPLSRSGLRWALEVTSAMWSIEWPMPTKSSQTNKPNATRWTPASQDQEFRTPAPMSSKR